MEKICECCKKKHDGKFGSGRFCSKFCSRSFSTKLKRKEINRKVSEKLSGRVLSLEDKEKLKEAWVVRKEKGKTKPKLPLELFFIENSKTTNQKIKNRLFEDGIRIYRCEECGIDSYNGKFLCLQLHHINGNNRDNRLENLQILCPNCHSQTENFAGKRR